MDFMTNFDRFVFIYRAPRAKIRRLTAAYRSKSREHLPDARSWLNKFAAHKSNYLFGFITDPLTAVFLIVWELFVFRTHPLAAAGGFVIGMASWTLLEYTFHRFIYHKGKTLAHTGHMMHHESPKLLLGMPWYITSGLFWVLWYVLARRLELRLVASVCSGLMLGYFFYCGVHHIQHHYSIANTWFRELTKHHNIHHSLKDVNFGVTNRFWDRVFGTTYRKETYKARTVARASQNRLR
jgi:dihydroceramide fatty acyl 2-hydroxylase